MLGCVMGWFGGIARLSLTIPLHNIPKAALQANIADSFMYGVYIVGLLQISLEKLSD